MGIKIQIGIIPFGAIYALFGGAICLIGFEFGLEDRPCIQRVFGSDWYYLRLVRWYGWVGEGYLRAEIPACPAGGVFESFWWGSVGLEEGLIKGVLRIVEGSESFFPESLLIGMKFFLKGGIT